MILLKLGGSLITDKSKAETPRMDVIIRLANEIAAVKQEKPELRLLLGHGSGSFGHPVAKKFGTHRGASSVEDWAGFSQVWLHANRLNRIVIEALIEVELPVVSLPPSASTISSGAEIIDMSVEPIERALDAGLIPVIQGDVAFDRVQGAAILSTEMIFRYLAPILKPELVLIAGVEPGVYRDYPLVEEILPELSEGDLPHLRLGPSVETDVTGGMADKVRQALAISQKYPLSKVRIFSGMEAGSLQAALRGMAVGTEIVSQADPSP